MFDGSSRLSYWEPKWFLALHQCIEYYSAMHYYHSDLQRSADEPCFLASLPKPKVLMLGTLNRASVLSRR